MSTITQERQANEQLVREMSEAIWGVDGRPDAVDEYFAENMVDHEPDETIEGRAAYKELEAGLRNAFPDLEGHLEFVMSDGEYVATRYSATGTHTGELWGIEPTGKEGTVTGQVIYRFEEGRIAECWHQFDRFGMFQQLGLIPEHPSA